MNDTTFKDILLSLTTPITTMADDGNNITNMANSTFSSSIGYFTTIDYCVFTLLLLVSIGIGIYFGYFDGKEKTTEEYLLGGRKMKTIPIAISLVASQLSAISIISLPSEVYSFGSQFMLMIAPQVIIVTVFINFVILPVFYHNHIDNCYAYLQMRFNLTVRNLVTFSFFLHVFLVLPIGNFIPALAFSHVTGYNVHLINAIVSTVCVSYTMMGGVKAVVWTDVVQACVMFVSVGLVFVLAVIKVGGLSVVWERSVEGERLAPFDMTFDLETRQTFWNLFFGMFCMWVSHVGLNQSCVQRIVALPSIGHARRALYIFSVGVILVVGFNCIMGLVMYAFYYDCDPIKAGIVGKSDQMIPHFVKDIVGDIPGMPGIFISSVFSASLSTVSAYLNSMAGILYTDYIRKIPNFRHTESAANLSMKIIIVVVGIYCVLMGFLVEKSSSIFQISYTCSSLSQGAIFGVFILGMLYPKANSRGAFWGMIISIIFLLWITIGNLIFVKETKYSYHPMPSDISGCDARNITINNNQNISSILLIVNAANNDNNGFGSFQTMFYTISFQWYSFIGSLVTIIVGAILSNLLGRTKDEADIVDRSLISPVAHCLLPKDSQHIEMKQKQLLKQNNRVNEKEEIMYTIN